MNFEKQHNCSKKLSAYRQESFLLMQNRLFSNHIQAESAVGARQT